MKEKKREKKPLGRKKKLLIGLGAVCGFLALLLVSSKDFKSLYFIPSPLAIFTTSNIKNAEALDIQSKSNYNITVLYSTAIFLGRCVP